MLGATFITAAAAALAPSSGAADPTRTLAPHIAQARNFAASEGEKVWEGYGTAPFGFLMITDVRETLLCRDQAPTGFVAGVPDKATGCRRFTRPRSGLPEGLLAAMPLFGLPAVIVMGTPEATARDEASWIRTILHEHFHQWQYELPNYFDRIKALDLHGGDQTGTWVLNYAFPYEDPDLGAAFAETAVMLAETLDRRATPEFGPALDKYLAARRLLAQRAGDRNWRYFEFQLWQEGVARWTEIRLGKWYPREDVRASAERLEQATIKELRDLRLADKKRDVVYAFGAGEAMLLQACWAKWRDSYASHLALGPLLESARSNCSTLNGRATAHHLPVLHELGRATGREGKPL